jgi:dinuclear metal center YbgI/SA1388 family protein
MQIHEITSFLEDWVPISSQASYDNCGLIIGNSNHDVSLALICLDCTEEVIDEAIEIGANLIIAHHPIIFKGLKKITGSNYVERTVLKAIKNNISIYAIHTNLDHSILGVNAEIARRLNISNPKILSPAESSLTKIIVFVPQDFSDSVLSAMFEAGAGKIGNYAECSFQSTGKGSFKPEENAHPFEGEIGKKTTEEEVKIEVLVSNHKLNKVIAALLEAHPYEEVAYDAIALKNKNPFEGSGMIGELLQPVETMTFLSQSKTNVSLLDNSTFINHKNHHKKSCILWRFG